MLNIPNLEITINHYLILSSLIFIIGICGLFINRKNVIAILMSVELILLSVNINFVAFSAYLQDLTGQIFTLFILTVAAAEAAIGLAIIVVYYRNRGTIEIEDISQMRG
jgi:NADH-quinone oxidoreductase subunit K